MLRSSGRIRFQLLCFLALLLIGCATTADSPEILTVPRISDFQPAWQPVFKGVDLAYGRKAAPDPVAVYAVRVDLRASGIGFLVTPSNGDRPSETDGLKTSTFMRKYGCQVAVNASPFSPMAEQEGAPQDIIGLSVSRGDVYSNPRGDRAALIITKDNRVAVVSPPFSLKDVYNGIGGFGSVLRQGRVTGENDVRHPRTAAGVSKDGRYLYLLVIDGRQPGYSAGATTMECAQWLMQLGAYDGLNLDGGGSTTLVIADEAGNPLLINRPIHNNIPGTERVTGNSLGIFAKRLK